MGPRAAGGLTVGGTVVLADWLLRGKGMGHIVKAPSGRWRANYRDPEGKQKAKTFGTKREASAWLAEVESAKNKGSYVDPRAGRIPFREYAEQYLAAQVLRPSSVLLYEGHLRNHVYPVIGDRPLSAVRRSDIQALVKRLSDGLAPSTTKTVYGIVATVFRSAVRDRLLTHSPCEKISTPKVAPREVYTFTPSEVVRLSEAVPDRYRALILTAAGTGLRQGEVFGLRLSRINFLRKTLTVDAQVVMLGSKVTLGPPKTEASVRTVPMPDFVVEALAQHLAKYPVTEPDGLVFTTATGLPIPRNRFHENAWAPALAKAGLPKGSRFHGLRHTYASLLIAANQSPKVIQTRLGHATITETMDTYGHLYPHSEDDTRAALTAAFAPASLAVQTAL
jgi:integrase